MSAIIIDEDDNSKFPEMLFNNAIRKFETAFNVIVDLSISYKSNRMTAMTKEPMQR